VGRDTLHGSTLLAPAKPLPPLDCRANGRTRPVYLACAVHRRLRGGWDRAGRQARFQP